MKENEYNLTVFIDQLSKWKKELLKSILLILVVSIIGSLLLPNYYRAETIFYAASPDLARPIPIGDIDKDIRIYGDDKDLDRLFSISYSHDLLFTLIDSFDLYSHYDIDKNSQKAKFNVKKILLKNYNVIKTKYGALQLIVEDKDPEKSSAIANAAREKIEEIAQKIVKESQQKLIKNYLENITIKQSQSDTLASKLKNIKETADIYETWGQSSLYAKMLSEATSELEEARGKISFYKKYPTFKDSVIKNMAVEAGATNKITRANAELQKYGPVLSELKQLEQEQIRLHDQISLDKERLKQLSATFNAPFTVLHVVENAVPPVEKSKPRRALLVCISFICGVAMILLFVFVIENVKLR